MMSTIDYHGKTALVTGASSGIGRAFAEALAARGANLLLAARSEKALAVVSEELRRKHGVTARAVAVDLSEEHGPDQLIESVGKVPIDILVNNAGFATYGRFEVLPVERDHREIMLNVTAVARLTHLVLPSMLTRGAGIILNVASTAAFQPLPFMAIYGATKAFVLSFTEALWAELRDRNVRVLAVCPGPTQTNFFTVVGDERAAGVGKRRTPDQVVSGALHALERGASCYVDGRRNLLQVEAIRLAPRRVVASGAAAVLRPRA
jgi:short-subunit dehydrogenase